jgi:hypothetical protein
MRYRRWIGWILVAVLGSVGVPYPAGADTTMHSGTLLSLDQEASTLVLEEVGPWRVERGVLVTMPRKIIFTRWTDFSAVTRAPDAPSGFRGDFVEVPVEPRDLKVGEPVTAECVRDAGRLIAMKVTVTRMNKE